MPYVDYFDPMVYPSHYYAGSFGFDVPNNHPYEVIDSTLKLMNAERVGYPMVIRPWIQDFGYGDFPPYTASQVLAEMQALRDNGAQGWMIWDTGITDAVATMPSGLAPPDPRATHWYRPKTLAAQLETLGVKPLLGRFFGPAEDDKPGANPVVVISHRLWQSRFAGDRNVVGKRVKINGYPFTVIGVAPPHFRGTELIIAADYWVPMSMELQIEPGHDFLHSRYSSNIWTMGRLKPGIAPRFSHRREREEGASPVRGEQLELL